ncbi:MAG: hemerythrin family protein [Gammaproteobacteria bacterium]|nr:hemerythrin family protein [Gammaproteobacteria bacterium]
MKKFFKWRNEWSLGIEVMDLQHRQLAEILNKIVELYLTNGEQTDLTQRSNQLHEQLNIFYDQVKKHFYDEEDLMHKTNYSGHTDHAHEHLMLLAELKHYLREVEEKQDDINTDTLSSLKTWFISHIIESDKEFADFLHANTQDDVISIDSVSSN